jgi:hypothetical protein
VATSGKLVCRRLANATLTTNGRLARRATAYSTACLSHYGKTRTLPNANDKRTDRTTDNNLEPATGLPLVEQRHENTYLNETSRKILSGGSSLGTCIGAESNLISYSSSASHI